MLPLSGPRRWPLDEIAKLLASKPELQLKVVVHGDDAVNTAPDRTVGSRRAQSVVGTLVGAHGITLERQQQSRKRHKQ